MLKSHVNKRDEEMETVFYAQAFIKRLRSTQLSSNISRLCFSESVQRVLRLCRALRMFSFPSRFASDSFSSVACKHLDRSVGNANGVSQKVEGKKGFQRKKRKISERSVRERESLAD
jgi:hypothetical protein